MPKINIICSFLFGGGPAIPTHIDNSCQRFDSERYSFYNRFSTDHSSCFGDIKHVLYTGIFLILSYALPLRPLPFKSGLARSWVRLALGSRSPLRLGSCLFASGQTGNVLYGLQGTLVYPSYPIYPSYVVIWEKEQLGKWKVSKGAKSGKEKSQETGTVRERRKSGKRQRQETGKVRKSLRIRCRHRNPCVQCTLVYPSCPVYPSDAVIWKGEKSAKGTSQGTGKVSNGEKSGNGKATNPTFPTFPEFS